ncbi:MAG: PadR family transcriptional regulator [Pseudomonadota bacterium]
MFSKDLIAASATPIVLSILREGDNYGYAIIERVHHYSDGDLAWKDGMLYPILYRLERKGFIESYTDTSGAGRKRKYYRLLESGRAALATQRAQWQRLNAIFTKLEAVT